MKKERLDKLIVVRGLARSREQAQRLIMAGSIRVDGEESCKPGHTIREDAPITLVSDEASRYVSRGGLKLEAALSHFDVTPTGRIALDIGASTGGFTDCLLQNGCTRVIAMDVGHGLLDWTLRNDPRVVVLERLNARYMTLDGISEMPDLVTMDVSFISLEKILPRVVELLTKIDLVTLVKPQFEVGRGQVGKGGVVRDPALHREVLIRISSFAGERCELRTIDACASPIKGPKGNREFFLHLSDYKPGLNANRIEETIDSITESTEDERRNNR